ncbi:MAG TPA: hypothetical protein VGO47_07420, partial [Chlamydiales bacterium]|nr:hypothetical protein [Chlamydiales bacterium]
GKFLDSLDTWHLACMFMHLLTPIYSISMSLAAERAVYAAKSLIIGLALIKGHLSTEEAAQAAQVEVTSQIERWGEVEDSK